VSVLVEIHSGQQWQLGGFFAKIGRAVYTLIVARVFLAGLLLSVALPAQDQPPPQKKLETQKPKPVEQEPPEEDESLKPEEYSLNPIQAQKDITAGNYYFKVKKNYRAAANRYSRASKWDPGSSEAFFKLAESDEKLKDLAGARAAYEKYLELTPDAKNSAEIKKKIAKWPVAK
jgi:tetratricopeptide (TPR) repeat protein